MGRLARISMEKDLAGTGKLSSLGYSSIWRCKALCLYYVVVLLRQYTPTLPSPLRGGGWGVVYLRVKQWILSLLYIFV